MTPRHVLVAMPLLTGVVQAHTFTALARSIPELATAGIVASFEVRAGESLLPHTRNALIGTFLKSECTDLVFVDWDVSWAPGTLTKLIQHPVDFVAGIYRFKRDEEMYPLNWLNEEWLRADPVNGLLRVATVPFGFVRLTRDAVLSMVDRYQNRMYRHYDEPDRELCALFDVPFVPSIGLVGEDFGFCDRWKAIGGQIWIDPEMTLSHTGLKTYEGHIGNWLKGRE